jgi:hypothetical protein
MLSKGGVNDEALLMCPPFVATHGRPLSVDGSIGRRKALMECLETVALR